VVGGGVLQRLPAIAAGLSALAVVIICIVVNVNTGCVHHLHCYVFIRMQRHGLRAQLSGFFSFLAETSFASI
jgi:hypothetical protein